MDDGDRCRFSWIPFCLIGVAFWTPASAEYPTGLENAKIALQLVPGVPGPDACDLIPESRCSDGLMYEVFDVAGGLDRDYQLYVIAVDINTSAGLATASFAIEYDAGVVVDDWRSCADEAIYSPDWPASVSHVGLGFTSCAGTQPSTQDPEGDGAVLLGVFHVRAHSAGRLAIGALDFWNRSAEVRDCAGVTTTLSWVREYPYPVGNVALGEVGFDYPVVSACAFPGIADDGCQLGWVNYTYRCCYSSGGCVGGMAQVSPRACEYAGGVWRMVRCAMSCYDPDCLAVPVQPSTWGTIKARY